MPSSTLNATSGAVYSLNEIGGRANLEDAISPFHPHVFVVCDGVGGNSSGEVASAKAVDAFYRLMASRYDTIRSLPQFTQLVREALEDFRQAISGFIAANPAARNTSTTLTLAVLHAGRAYLAWCGDSRIYQVRQGRVVYRTKDHSLVQELISKGVITEKEAEHHPQRNIIIRSLNVQTKPADIETAVLEDVRAEDWLLLCTDGLMEQFAESHFPAYLAGGGEDLGARIRTLCEGRTKDNFSMHLVRYGGDGARKAGIKKAVRLLAWIVPAAVVLAGTTYALTRDEAPTGGQQPLPGADTLRPPASGHKREQRSLFRSQGEERAVEVPVREPAPADQVRKEPAVTGKSEQVPPASPQEKPAVQATETKTGLLPADSQEKQPTKDTLTRN